MKDHSVFHINNFNTPTWNIHGFENLTAGLGARVQRETVRESASADTHGATRAICISHSAFTILKRRLGLAVENGEERGTGRDGPKSIMRGACLLHGNDQYLTLLRGSRE